MHIILYSISLFNQSKLNKKLKLLNVCYPHYILTLFNLLHQNMSESSVKNLVLGAEKFTEGGSDVKRWDAMLGSDAWFGHSHMDEELKVMLQSLEVTDDDVEYYSKFYPQFTKQAFSDAIASTESGKEIYNWNNPYWPFALHKLMHENGISKLDAIYMDWMSIQHYKPAKQSNDEMHRELIMLVKLFLKDGGELYIPRYTIWLYTKGSSTTRTITSFVNNDKLQEGQLTWEQEMIFPESLNDGKIFKRDDFVFDIFVYHN